MNNTATANNDSTSPFEARKAIVRAALEVQPMTAREIWQREGAAAWSLPTWFATLAEMFKAGEVHVAAIRDNTRAYSLQPVDGAPAVKVKPKAKKAKAKPVKKAKARSSEAEVRELVQALSANYEQQDHAKETLSVLREEEASLIQRLKAAR